MKISPHFTLQELTVTATGRANLPDNEEHWRNLYWTAYGMEMVRAFLDNLPITVTSAYRNREVNRIVGGVNNSAHCKAYAVDWRHSKYKAIDCCRIIAASPILYDQLILERNNTLIHISFDPRFRQQNLRQPGGPGSPVYETDFMR